MPAHLEVDDTHKDFVFATEHTAKWQVAACPRGDYNDSLIRGT